MIGDTIILNRESKRKAKYIIRQIQRDFSWNMSKKEYLREVWTMGGESGTLKTESALELQLLLWKLYKLKVYIINLDDYYFSWYNERNKIRKQKGIESVGIVEIEWEKIHVIINAFRKKELLRMEQIHRFCEVDVYSTVESKNINILLFEGLYANWLKKGFYSEFNIFLDGTIEQTEKFRKKRGKEIIDDFRRKILIKESEDVKRTKSYAGMIVPFKIGGKK